jgi:hypothetical protein
MLIAATAAGFGLVRFMYHDHYLSNYLTTLTEQEMPGKLVLVLEDLARLTSPVALVLTMATLGLAIVRRPGIGELMRQPGLASCLTVSFFLLVAVAVRLTYYRLSWMHKFSIGYNYGGARDLIKSALWETFSNAPPGVVACWATLALTSGWKPDPDRLDRCGRIVGIYWVLLNLMPR